MDLIGKRVRVVSREAGWLYGKCGQCVAFENGRYLVGIRNGADDSEPFTFAPHEIRTVGFVRTALSRIKRFL